MQLEQGIEIPIPKQLQIKTLPLSYQYYDCILGMVRSKISDQQKILILKKADLDILDPGKKPEDVTISFSERVGRYFKRVWFNEKIEDDHQYK